MDNFYLIVTIVALGILIVCLSGIAILMRFQNSGDIFPPSVGSCPDYWNASADGKYCTIPPKDSKNTGKIYSYDASFGQFTEDSADALFIQSNGKYTPYYPGGNTTLYSSLNGGNIISGNGHMNGNTVMSFHGNVLNTVCSQNAWANTYDINWDGVSNSRNC
jgi:hypothetical protein